MKKQKLIIVTSAIGRCGTSATMGLLKLAGVQTEGKTLKTKKASPYNQKGFFELALNGLVSTFLKEPPRVDILDTFSKNKLNYLSKSLQREFKNCPIIGIKVLRHLLIPSFYMLREEYDIYVIVLTRNIVDQARSHADIHRKPGVKSFVDSKMKEIKKWKAFSKKIRSRYRLRYCTLSFENLIRDPVSASKKIASFVRIAVPKREKVLEWIDTKLVHFDVENEKFDPVTKRRQK